VAIRTLIAEDEPLARGALRELIAEVTWLELVGEAADGHAAIRLIDQLRPDLVFLDVRMPERSGLDVLRAVQHRPAIVFTTAHHLYAVAAFELEALDYLLKPFGRNRFAATLERVRRRLPGGDAAFELPPPGGRVAVDERGALERIFAPHAGRIVPVRVADIVLLASEDDYTRVHAHGQQYLVGITLSAFERALDPARFCRVHRSAIVALDHVASIERCDRRFVLHMRDGTAVVASRAGSQALRSRIG
jgi:two-component system, LytTR family, response regulator